MSPSGSLRRLQKCGEMNICLSTSTTRSECPTNRSDMAFNLSDLWSMTDRAFTSNRSSAEVDLGFEKLTPATRLRFWFRIFLISATDRDGFSAAKPPSSLTVCVPGWAISSSEELWRLVNFLRFGGRKDGVCSI